MSTILQSEVFFFISSIGFVTLWILLAILLVYLIRISRTFSRIIDKAERDINSIGDATKEILEEMRDSSMFHFLTKVFRRKRNNKTKQK